MWTKTMRHKKKRQVPAKCLAIWLLFLLVAARGAGAGWLTFARASSVCAATMRARTAGLPSPFSTHFSSCRSRLESPRPGTGGVKQFPSLGLVVEGDILKRIAPVTEAEIIVCESNRPQLDAYGVGAMEIEQRKVGHLAAVSDGASPQVGLR
jgi:hypothetical protein